MARLYDAFYVALGALAASLFVAMALLISADIVMRNVGLGTIPWVLEASEYMQYVAAFIGTPWVLWLGGHVRVDLLLHSVPPPVARALEVLADLFGVVISAALLYFATAVGWTSYVEGDRVIKSFIFPEFWVFALLAVAAFLLLVEFCRRLWRARTAPLPGMKPLH
ncbi:MAG: TRAP transporter small permease [Candidatus Eiseniibacteriota bacterium]